MDANLRRQALGPLVAGLLALAPGTTQAQRAWGPSAPNSTVSSSTTTTTSAVALTVPGAPPRNMSVRVLNTGAAPVFIAFGTSGVTTATTTGLPVPAGVVNTFTVPEGTTHAATIIAAATATVYFTVGEGAQ
jgi:hypothetical protein